MRRQRNKRLLKVVASIGIIRHRSMNGSTVMYGYRACFAFHPAVLDVGACGVFVTHSMETVTFLLLTVYRSEMTSRYSSHQAHLIINIVHI